MPDLHVVKEIQYFNDGTSKPHVHVVENFQRPFWVTRQGHQNHEQKKEWEKIEHVIPGHATQTELVRRVASVLKKPWFEGDMRHLAESPYVYGTDISSTSVLKKSYQDKYPMQMSKYTVGTFDTETDVLNGTEEIIMATFTFGKICHTAVVKGFVEGLTDVEARVDEKMKRYLGEHVEKRELICTLDLVDNAIEAVRSCINMAHKHKPDFLTIWNMDFDITKILNACDKYGVDPADIFSDPAVAPAYRYFKYKQGKKQKLTASGKMSPIKPAAQWHVVTAPASFTVVDGMCVYKQVRTGKPEEQSYGLSAILDLNLGIRKLDFEEAEHLSNQKLKWHQFMQAKYKIEYIIYNRFDCIGMELLDEKTQDLAMSMPMFSGCSDFATFNSQPKRMIDRLHFYVQGKGLVMGSTGPSMENDFDEDTVDLKGWIVTLPAELIHDNGLQLILEDAGLRTNIRMHVGDLDVAGSYPTGECTMNISKETTVKELVEVEGIPDETMRMQGINLSGAQSNAAEFCQTIFKCPQFFDLLDMFERDLAVDQNLPPVAPSVAMVAEMREVLQLNELDEVSF